MKRKHVISWLLALGLFSSLCYVPAVATDEGAVSPEAEEQALEDESALVLDSQANAEEDTVQESLVLVLDAESDSESDDECDHPIPSGTKYAVDTDGDGEADAEYENYDDIPCEALIQQLEYTCPNCGESVGIGEEYKPHTYTSVYLVDGKECDYDDIPCGTVYTEKYTCESCGDSYEIEWEKLHEVPDDSISTEDSVKCGEIYTISYTCPQCKQNIVEEFEKEHSLGFLYVTVADGKTVDDYSELACEEEYVTTYTCRICGYSYSDEAESKAHEPDDEVVYYDEDGSEVDVSDLKCEKEYTMEFVCGLCGEAVSQPFALEHEPGEDGTFYAAANVTSTDDEKGASFDVVGAYTNDLDNIGCGTWYVEKFTCMYCDEEIVQLASYKDHQWETVNGEEVCSVCGNEGEDKGEADLPGDINGDGKVNVADVVRLAQYVKAKYVGVEIASGSGDTNGDGKVNVADVVRLAQYVKAKYVGVEIY